MCIWNPLEDVHRWGYCNRMGEGGELPHKFRQESHGCTRQPIHSVKNSLGCYLNYCTTASCTLLDMNVHFGHSLMVRRCKNCMWDVWASTKAWHALGPELFGWHRYGHCHKAKWCQQLVYPGIQSSSWYVGIEEFDINGLWWLYCYYQMLVTYMCLVKGLIW